MTSTSGEKAAMPGRVATFFLEKKVAQSPALRDPAFRGFESGKTSPEIERTMMRLPASRNFVPSSELHLQRSVHLGRNLNPQIKHLPACHDFGTESSFSLQVEIVRLRRSPFGTGVSDGVVSCVSFHPQCAEYSGSVPLSTGVK